jgi:hypothetical protein
MSSPKKVAMRGEVSTFSFYNIRIIEIGYFTQHNLRAEINEIYPIVYI